MRFRFPAPWLLAAAVLLLPAGVLAGQGFEIEYAGTADGEARSVVVRVDDDHLRLSPEGETEEIVLGPEGFTVIKHDEKMVYVMTYSQLESMMAGMGKMMEGLEEMKAQQLETLKETRDATEDAEARAALDAQIEEMEAEMGKKESGPKVAFASTGNSAKVAGHDVKEAQVTEDGEVKATIWTTDAIPSGHIMAAAKRVVDILPGPIRDQVEWSQMLVTLPGFPLKIESEDMTAEATRVEAMDFGADAWTQEGYESGAFPMMGGMGGGFGGN